jgi:hypothetical protein
MGGSSRIALATTFATTFATLAMGLASAPARADERPVVAPTAAAPSPDKWPSVRLDSSKPGAALYRRDETKKLIDRRGTVDDVWEFVCYAPCNKKVDPEATYRVLGASIPPSDTFTLGSEDVTLKIDAGSTRLQLFGRGLGGLGLASVVASGVFFVAQGATDNENKEASLRTLGQIFLVGGLTLVITSVVLDSLASTTLRVEGRDEKKSSSSGIRAIPFGFAF